jgi:hypothetical protein
MIVQTRLFSCGLRMSHMEQRPIKNCGDTILSKRPPHADPLSSNSRASTTSPDAMAPLPRRAACVGLPTPSVVVQWIYPNRAGDQVLVNLPHRPVGLPPNVHSHALLPIG